MKKLNLAPKNNQNYFVVDDYFHQDWYRVVSCHKSIHTCAKAYMKLSRQFSRIASPANVYPYKIIDRQGNEWLVEDEDNFDRIEEV